MLWLEQLFANKIIWAATISWAVAQIIKVLLYWLVNKEFRLERLFGDGGMPSGHSAFVSAAATACGVVCGLDSPIFAISALLAIVVMHDARGVRREAGKQARLLRDLVEALKFPGESQTQAERLKQFVGHTPAQVFIGSLLGIVVALICTL